MKSKDMKTFVTRLNEQELKLLQQYRKCNTLCNIDRLFVTLRLKGVTICYTDFLKMLQVLQVKI